MSSNLVNKTNTKVYLKPIKHLWWSSTSTFGITLTTVMAIANREL